MAKVTTILDQIDAGTMLLPEFQRGYVWNRDQVRGLMRSLYRDYPVGALLVWATDDAGQAVRGLGGGAAGAKQLLLDGQQRVTTLYGIMRGRAPSFFEGDASAFTGLRFNVGTESFEFYAPVKMKDDPLWVDVTALFVEGPAVHFDALNSLPDGRITFGTYMARLTRLHAILQREIHAEQITGADKTVDVVVDIFNRVNSGGTKLSKGDLALAKICAEWGLARPQMRAELTRWQSRGYDFTLDWLLRNVNAVATGKAPFAALEDVDAAAFEQALTASVAHIDHFLTDLVAGRLGLDHDRVLMGRYAFPVISRLLHQRNGRFADGREADRALYWYIHAALRGRFAGSTETVLTKDLETVDKTGMDGLIKSLVRSRAGNLRIDAQDFEGIGRGSRFYPLLYLLTRVRAARDLRTGTVLGEGANSLEVHEIFPKAALYRHGYPRGMVNAVANFVFVTPSTAQVLGNRSPVDYMAECSPDALASQWIPDDSSLLSVERYPDFLAARRELLAATADEFLDQLLAGTEPWRRPLATLVVGSEVDVADSRTAQVRALVAELAALGYAEATTDTEIVDDETGRTLTVADAVWSFGLQAGQGSPVVLQLDQQDADLPRLTELGYEVFASVEALRGFAARRGAAVSGDEADDAAALRAEPVEDEQAPEAVFDRELSELLERWQAESYVDAGPFGVAVADHGALRATRMLLDSPAVGPGFETLWERRRLDMTVESLVLADRFANLFSADEMMVARARLDDFGFEAVQP